MNDISSAELNMSSEPRCSFLFLWSPKQCLDKPSCIIFNNYRLLRQMIGGRSERKHLTKVGSSHAYLLHPIHCVCIQEICSSPVPWSHSMDIASPKQANDNVQLLCLLCFSSTITSFFFFLRQKYLLKQTDSKSLFLSVQSQKLHTQISVKLCNPVSLLCFSRGIANSRHVSPQQGPSVPHSVSPFAPLFNSTCYFQFESFQETPQNHVLEECLPSENKSTARIHLKLISDIKVVMLSTSKNDESCLSIQCPDLPRVSSALLSAEGKVAGFLPCLSKEISHSQQHLNFVSVDLPVLKCC